MQSSEAKEVTTSSRVQVLEFHINMNAMSKGNTRKQRKLFLKILLLSFLNLNIISLHHI